MKSSICTWRQTSYPGSAHPDDDEFVVAEWVSIESLIDSVLDGRIEDSKTVIAALICDALRHRM